MLLFTLCGQKDNMFLIQLLEVCLEQFLHLIGWAAVDPNLDIMAWMLFLIMFAWQPPHFYALAMRRVEEYRTARNSNVTSSERVCNNKKTYIIFGLLVLMPFPFFMNELGISFIVLATILKYGLDCYRDIWK